MNSPMTPSTVFAITMLASTVAFAQGNAFSKPPASVHRAAATQFNATDQKFIDDAAIGGLYEVKAGQLAEKSSNPKVREFGARMVKDHSSAGAQLKQLVAAEGGTMPQKLDQQHQQDLDRLASLKDADFDREYVQKMVKDHDEDAQAFAEAGNNLTDQRLKRFTQATLSVIQSHNKMAHEIDGSMTTR